MEISLEQAIEIHAKVLKKRHKLHAPREAREHAQRLKNVNDYHGHQVWNKVAAVAERMIVKEFWEHQGED
jgi:hypothetical protein